MSDLWSPQRSPAMPVPYLMPYRMPPRVVAFARWLLVGMMLLIAGLPMRDALAATTVHHPADSKHRPVVAKKKKKIVRKPKPSHRARPAAAASKRRVLKRASKRGAKRARMHPPARVHSATVAKMAPLVAAAVVSPATASTTSAPEAPELATASQPTSTTPSGRTPETPPFASRAAAATPKLLRRCGFTKASQRHLFSHAVYIVDEKTHTPLFARNAEQVVPIASISKLMTAIVWLDANADAPMREHLEVTDDDLDTLKFTHSRLSVGSSLTRADMLHIALMSSENRAAAALSRDYVGGRPAFIAAMNAKALALDMPHTHFENATGLSPQNVSTAHELARLVRAANGYALIRRDSTDHQRMISTSKGQLQYVSTNRLVRYGQIHASVQKTGFINESGHNMVMRVMVHSTRPVIVTMLGSVTPEGSRLDGVRIAHWLSCSLS